MRKDLGCHSRWNWKATAKCSPAWWGAHSCCASRDCLYTEGPESSCPSPGLLQYPVLLPLLFTPSFLVSVSRMSPGSYRLTCRLCTRPSAGPYCLNPRDRQGSYHISWTASEPQLKAEAENTQGSGQRNFIYKKLLSLDKMLVQHLCLLWHLPTGS